MASPQYIWNANDPASLQTRKQLLIIRRNKVSLAATNAIDKGLLQLSSTMHKCNRLLQEIDLQLKSIEYALLNFQLAF